MSNRDNIVHRIKKSLSIKRNIRRGRVVVGLVDTMIGSYRTATRIEAWREPPRHILPRYIQIFCRKSANAFGVKVVEVESVPKDHALWVSNHVSWMDIPVVGSVTPAFFLSKAEVAKMPIIGPLAKVAGTLFINRGSGDSGSVAEQMTEFLKTGYSIVFFPEGTTTDGKQIKKVHGKLLQSAIDADKPIQPLVLCYVNSKGELDSSVPFYGGMSFGESLFNVIDDENMITAYVLPLASISVTGKTKSELTEELQQSMQDGLAELHRRVVTKR